MADDEMESKPADFAFEIGNPNFWKGFALRNIR